MDAAYKLPKNTAILSLLALVAIAPWHAQAQTFGTTSTSLTVGSNGVQTLNITGTTDSTHPLTFSVGIVYTDSAQPWLSFNGVGCGGPSHNPVVTYTTPITVTFAPGCTPPSQGTHTATVTLTETSPNPGATEVITVSFTSGSSGGSGTVAPSVNSVTLSAAPGGISSYATFTLGTFSTSSISYSIVTPSVPWLFIVSGQTGSVSSGASATVQLQASAIGLSSSPPSTNLQVQYNGTSFYVPVNFNVGTGTVNGTLTFAQSTFNFSYNTGGATPSAQSTTVANTTASSYSFVVNASPAGWLLVNSLMPTNGSSYGSYSIGSGVFLQPANTSLNTGTYTATVTITDSSGNTGTLTANLSVNGGSGGTFTIYPNPITASAPLGTNTVLVPVSVSSSVGGTLSATVSSATAGALSLYSGSSQTVTAGSAVTVTVEGNASGLQAGTYTGSLLLSLSGSASQTYPISFTVGGGSSGGGGTTPSSSTVAPTALNFFYEIGQPVAAQQLTQFITIAGPGNFTISQPTESNSSVAWLTVGSASGSSPTEVQVYANPTPSSTNSLIPGTYNGSFIVNFTASGLAQTVTVTFTVTSATPLLVLNPGVVNVSCASCATIAPTFVQVLATDGSTLPVTVASASTGGWLSAAIAGTYTSSTPTSVQLTFNSPGSLANGLYTATVTVTSGALSANIPVVLLVSGASSSGNLSLSPSSMTFNAVVNGSSPPSQTLTIGPSTTTNFNLSASTSTGGNWLTLSTSGSLYTPLTVTVTASQANLPVGTYYGTISLASGGITQTVQVSMVVSTTGSSGGNVTVSPTSLTNFTYQTGGTVPAAETLTVSSSSGNAGVPFTAGASSQTNAGAWLVVSPTSGNTQATVTVSLSASVLASLSAGTYNGNVVITPTSGTGAITLPVTLTVIAAPTVTATPASLSFAYQAGGNQPSTATIAVAGSATGLTFSATASTTTGGAWLSISPSTGTAPSSITVSVSSSVLSGLVAGSYSGTVVVSGTGSATGSTTINVTLTVTAPLPTITAVVNAASFQAATAVSPGEIVSIGGTAIGPTSPVSLTLDSGGKVSNSIGNVTVLFNGFPAPLIYVSATQINCIVPYEIAGSISPYVQVKYLGQTSNAWSVQPAVSAPAIFTANAGGTGPGAILNADGSFNSQKAAPKGSEIVVYMTGEGQTSPGGVDGKVTTVNSSGLGPLTPAPLLPVSALIGGQPAQVVFFGEAPALVSGVLQVNLIVPATAPTGNLPISVSVGSNISQQGVTVAVQ